MEFEQIFIPQAAQNYAGAQSFQTPQPAPAGVVYPAAAVGLSWVSPVGLGWPVIGLRRALNCGIRPVGTGWDVLVYPLVLPRFRTDPGGRGAVMGVVGDMGVCGGCRCTGRSAPFGLTALPLVGVCRSYGQLAAGRWFRLSAATWACWSPVCRMRTPRAAAETRNEPLVGAGKRGPTPGVLLAHRHYREF